MTEQTVIVIEELMADVEKRARINNLNLEDIVWLENGKVVDVALDALESWELIGLSNIDFITSGAYLKANK